MDEKDTAEKEELKPTTITIEVYHRVAVSELLQKCGSLGICSTYEEDKLLRTKDDQPYTYFRIDYLASESDSVYGLAILKYITQHITGFWKLTEKEIKGPREGYGSVEEIPNKSKRRLEKWTVKSGDVRFGKESCIIPRVFDLTTVNILNPFLFVEREFKEFGALEFITKKYYALAQIQELNNQIIIQSDSPISFSRGSICLSALSSREVDEIPIPPDMLRKPYNIKDDNILSILADTHSRRTPGIYFKERGRMNKAYIKKIQEMGDDEFETLINNYIFTGWEYDPRVWKWGESGALHISNDRKDFRLMKYRGHSLVIKNSSSGFTSIAEEIGRCFGHNTEASLRGFSDGKTDKNSLLNDEFGSVVIDEFLNQPPTGQGALNYMQIGRSTTTSGAVELEYKGLAKLSWVGNQNKDASTVEGMIIALENGMEKLSDSSVVGLGARFGCVIWDDKVTAARRNKKITDAERDETSAVVKDIIRIVAPELVRIYKDSGVEDWFEERDSEYDSRVRGLATQIIQTGNNKIKGFVENNGNAIRHIKGFAMEVALKRHLRSIFLEKYDIKKILKNAKEEYEEVKSININSFIKCVGWYNSIDVHALAVQRFNNLPTEATKAVVLALFEASKHITDGHVLTEMDMNTMFDQIPIEDRKKILGNFSHWGTVKHKLPRRYIQKFQSVLRNNFCVEVEVDENYQISFKILEVDLLRALSINGILKRTQSVETVKKGESVETVETVENKEKVSTDSTDSKNNKKNKIKRIDDVSTVSTVSTDSKKSAKSFLNQINQIRSIICTLVDTSSKNTADIIDIELNGQAKGIMRDETQEIINELKIKGIIYESPHGQLNLTDEIKRKNDIQ